MPVENVEQCVLLEFGEITWLWSQNVTTTSEPLIMHRQARLSATTTTHSSGVDIELEI